MFATFFCLRQINWYWPLVRGLIGKINLPHDSVVRLCCLCRSFRILLNPLGTGVLRTQPDQTYGNDHHKGSLSTTRSSLSRQWYPREAAEGVWETVGCTERLSYSYFLIMLGPRRALSTSGACCFPVSIKCGCNPTVRGACHCPKVPASLRLPAP